MVIFTLTFWPVLQAELFFILNPQAPEVIVQSETENTETGRVRIYPVDEQFGIVIPKIRANSKVIANVDPFNEKEYQLALTQGVAHAKNTSVPSQDGNIFIFSHSSVNFYEALRYNSVFYLLSKLEKGDDIYLFYEGKKYKYKVSSKITTFSDDLSYLIQKTYQKRVTLMTCWPPGTTLERLIVVGEIE